jgi:hypothetical protein
MRLFKCNHNWVTKYRSNALQQDKIGYPMRLFVCKCSKCGRYDQKWLPVSKKEWDELETGDSVLVEWRDIK